MSSQTPAMNTPSGKPILLLAFANAAQNPLKIHQEKIALVKALVNELREVDLKEEDIKNEYKTDLCEIMILSEASIDSIIDAFEDKKYKDKHGKSRIAVFHYAGHAGDDALLLESKQGGGDNRRAYSQGLISLFKEQSKQGMLKFVFLNGCSSQRITEGFLEVGVPAVLGTTKAIQDSMAKDLSERFYKGLGQGNSILRSWNIAEAQIRSYFKDDLNSSYRPVIFNRESELPDQFPWQIRFGKGADHQGLKGWNLPEASQNPLHNLPLPNKYYANLPSSPYTGLNYFREKDAAIFFGRGAEIRNLHNTIMEDNRVILMHGKSGVGKSSLLFAGLIPRMKHYYPIYFRRNQEKGLLQSLMDAILEQLPDADEKVAKGSEQSNEMKSVLENIEALDQRFNLSGEAEGGGPLDGMFQGFGKSLDMAKEGIREMLEWEEALELGKKILENWSQLEKLTQKPVLLIIDQVEEIFTRPTAGSSNFIEEAELDLFLEATKQFISLEEQGIDGKVIFSFRKEYFSDIREIFNEKHIPFVDFHLNTLEKKGIVGAIKGVQTNPSLKKHYKIEYEEELPDKIALDILADSDASVAPMLQIIMRKLWDQYAANPKPELRELLLIKDEFYQSGISTTMEDFFHSQVEIFKTKGFVDLVENGWLYEVLNLHTTRLGTATSYQSYLLEDLFCQDHDEIVKALLELQRCFLLVGLEVQSGNNHVTLLAHDTLAPIVRRVNEESDYPGQRARRILYGKMRNIQYWFPAEKREELEGLKMLKDVFFEKNRNYDLLRESIRKTIIKNEREFNDFWHSLLPFLKSDFEEKLPQIYLSEYEIQTIKAGEHGMRKRTFWENRLLDESERKIKEHKQEVQRAIGQSKYNLALAFEVQATRMVEEIELLNNHNSAFYEKAWLYGLHALNQEFPSHKSLPTTLSRIASSNLSAGPFRRLWKSPAFLKENRFWLREFSADCSSIAFKENSGEGFNYGKIDVKSGEIRTFLRPEDMGSWKWSAQKASCSLDLAKMAFIRIENDHRIQLVFMDTNSEEYLESFSIDINNPNDRFWLEKSLLILHHPELDLVIFGTTQEIFIKELNGPIIPLQSFDEYGIGLEVKQLKFSRDGKILLLLDSEGQLYLYHLWNEDSGQIEYERILYPPYKLDLDFQEDIIIDGVEGTTKSRYKIKEAVISSRGKYIALQIGDPNDIQVNFLKLFSMERASSSQQKWEDHGSIL